MIAIAGVENPLVVYARKDTPPGLKVATDIMKAKDFKALSLNAQNSNTVNQSLALDILGLKYQAIPAYRGLKEVETAILQNIGQLANSSLPGWRGSIQTSMGDVVIPLWQIAARAKDGSYPRSPAVPELPTFEEFYAWVNGGKKPSGFMYEVLRASSDPLVAMFRIAMMPPKTNPEAVAIMRQAFVDMWKDQAFINDYSNVMKSPPILVSGADARGDRRRPRPGEAGDQGVPGRLHQEAGEVARRTAIYPLSLPGSTRQSTLLSHTNSVLSMDARRDKPGHDRAVRSATPARA